MTVKQLKEFIADIPDNATVVVEAEYGIHKENAKGIYVTRERLENENADELIYEYEHWQDYYDVDAVEEYPINNEITGVLISAY